MTFYSADTSAMAILPAFIVMLQGPVECVA